MKALGIYMNKDQSKEMMEKADKDGSGSIEMEEFMSLMAEKINTRNPKEEVSKAFRMYDDDDGGTIDFINLRKVASELAFDNITDEDCIKMIKIADRKGLGEVDIDDFMAVMSLGGLFWVIHWICLIYDVLKFILVLLVCNKFAKKNHYLLINQFHFFIFSILLFFIETLFFRRRRLIAFQKHF